MKFNTFEKCHRFARHFCEILNRLKLFSMRITESMFRHYVYNQGSSYMSVERSNDEETQMNNVWRRWYLVCVITGVRNLMHLPRSVSQVTGEGNS